ncbi:hypothetical protein ABPG74_006397 [Tetrahymena malaccensis]
MQQINKQGGIGGFQSDIMKQYQSQERVDPSSMPYQKMYLSFSGSIESGEFDSEDTLMCQYEVAHGNSFSPVDNNQILEGKSQFSVSNSLYTRDIVFNLPFEATFSTDTPFGWPQLVISVFGKNFFGLSEVRGYGSVHIPTQPGYHERIVRVYRPLATSKISEIFSFFSKQEIKYHDAKKVIAYGEGREVTRVKSVGTIKVKFNVMKRNFKREGYS